MRRALGFVVLFGVVSLFADVTYEGARSITGPFLALLGASGAVVGFVAGLGELIGYGLRLASGYLADRTRRYWELTLVGYSVNLLAVPAIALAGRWEVAALLMILERTGKAIRTPSRDVMLSHATSRLGRGWGFGLHEALDQIGAVAGPLLAAGVLSARGSYRQAFALLGVAAFLALGALVVARVAYPSPSDLEGGRVATDRRGLGRPFWLYCTATALVAAGYADFPLIAFRLQKDGIALAAWVPILYAVAMGVDALAALLFGKLFDRYGLRVLAVVVVVSSAFAPLVFLGGFPLVVAGMVCWGVGMGAQESIMRAAIADLVPARRRGTAYGLFNAGYGLAWFLGSALIGVLYDVSVGWLVAFSVAAQLAAVPVLLLAGRAARVAGPA
ncbi:MAG TPA: MFS transporter [Candidatus Krumholzibacteria bacterium]|nr:MFS transporter [Candidatus Krumholzibacteria bacterium]HPD70321.1 MFS transporter [Candidatus Krumholzibacteria bacterium]HRY39979.1 MFS transporter [Candidatus Krumholzibacteria bacterium]